MASQFVLTYVASCLSNQEWRLNMFELCGFLSVQSGMASQYVLTCVASCLSSQEWRLNLFWPVWLPFCPIRNSVSICFDLCGFLSVSQEWRLNLFWPVWLCVRPIRNGVSICFVSVNLLCGCPIRNSISCQSYRKVNSLRCCWWWFIPLDAFLSYGTWSENN